MTDIEKAIADLLIPDGKPSPKMTRALKYIGDGSMQNGLTKIADYFTKIGEHNAFKKGAIVGSVGSLAVASIVLAISILIKNKIAKDKALETEGVAILKDIEQAMHSDEGEIEERNDTE